MVHCSSYNNDETRTKIYTTTHADLEHAKTLNQVQNLIMAKTEGIMVNSSH
jgi:hypothetical protein